MKFQTGEAVVVIDTTNKPAGTGVIISYNPFTSYYKIKLTYYDLGRQEETEVPEQRLMLNTEIVNPVK